MLQDETLRSFNFFIGAGSVKVSVCPEYPVLTSVFCSTARPSSTLSCSASWRGAAHGWPSSCISGSAPGSGSSLVPPVSPPTYTDNLQHFTQLVWADTTRTGEYNNIWKQGNLFLLLCPGCSWSHCRSPTDPVARVSEVVYNWVAAGNMEREAVYSQAAACSDCGPGYGCVEEDGALCVVNTGRIRSTPICLLQGGCQKAQ